MDHLFSAFVSRRTSSDNRQSLGQSSSCGDIRPHPVYISLLKRASFGNRHLPSSVTSDSTRNSELISVVDAQLMQIRAKLASFREQDTQFRERMDSLNDSVSELASRSSLSSFTPSECSDLGSLDEASQEEEEFEQTVGRQSEGYLRASVIGSRHHFNRPENRPLSARCFHIRRATSDPSSMQSHIELPEEEAMETQRHSTYSADQSTNLYPQYDNPEEISTLF